MLFGLISDLVVCMDFGVFVHTYVCDHRSMDPCIRHWTVATLTERVVFSFQSNENKHELQRLQFFFIYFFPFFFFSSSLTMTTVIDIVVFRFECRLWSQLKCVHLTNEIHFSVCQEHLDTYHSLSNTFRSHQRIQLLCIKSICLLFEHASFITTSTSCIYDK